MAKLYNNINSTAHATSSLSKLDEQPCAKTNNVL